MVVAQSRLSCADPSEQTFWTMPTWARPGPSGVAMLLETAEAAYARARYVPRERLCDISLFIDLHLASFLQLKAAVESGEQDDVSVAYKAGFAPEQVDPRTLHGHYCGALKHSSTIVRALTRTLNGRRVMSELLVKAVSPDVARVRYVDTNVLELIEEPDGLVKQLLVTASFGGLPGVDKIASVKSRLEYWNDTAGLVRLIISKLAKRGLLLALAEAMSRIPCALLKDNVVVRISGSLCAAIFSADVPPKRCIKVATPGEIRDAKPGSPDWSAPKISGLPPRVVLDAVVKFTYGSDAIPGTDQELQMLEYIVARADSVRVSTADPAVRSAQIQRNGLSTANFCTSCHSVHGVTPVRTSKAQRVITVFGSAGPRCSGCGSCSVARLDLSGRVLDFKLPRGRALLAPCTECGQLLPIETVYGGLPFCARHAVDEAVAEMETRSAACAICDVALHGEGTASVIECEDALHKICVRCQSILPTTRWTRSELHLLRSRKE